METRSNHILVGGVVLAMIVAVLAFIIWLTQISTDEGKKYDIFFDQAVDGLAKGSVVSFSGVPVGQVEAIALDSKNPEFVRVRITVRTDTPVLQGTIATIQGVGFTGVSQIQLDGAARGAPPITKPGPYGAPVIPARRGTLGELLNNAPKLLERVSTLTQRLTMMLGDDNQRSVKNILANTERLSRSLADRSSEIAATFAEARLAIAQAGQAAAAFERAAGSADALLNEQGKPLVQDLRATIQAAETSMKNLDAMLASARPGVDTLTRQTMPEIGLLVQDLRETTENLNTITRKIDQHGLGGLVSGDKLPTYKGK